MKYMGSKRYMLKNGFGSAITAAAVDSKRVVDLFAGSAAVSWYAAERFEQPVLSVDLQSYSAVLARAVISRTEGLEMEGIERAWLRPTLLSARATKQWGTSKRFDCPRGKTTVREARRLCAREGGGPITIAYGGHYFSPRQALLIDRALMRLPIEEPESSACRAALIAAAAYCAAAPGHTAQPFQPTASALPYIRENWARDPLAYARTWLTEIAPRHARRKGSTQIADALDVATGLGPGDLVIIDPLLSRPRGDRSQ
jgi:adenine-specific DNA-methyltransferase